MARVLAGEAEPNAADGAHAGAGDRDPHLRARERRPAGREGYDLCDTTHCQVLRAARPTRRAALATAGLVLTYNGAPAEVFYSASCGGRTERARRSGRAAHSRISLG